MDMVKYITLVLICCCEAAPNHQANVVYEFTSIDYTWTKADDRTDAIADGRYNISNNVITGIKVYKDDVFVTVPRWRPGVPSTLNRVQDGPNKSPILQPYPSWEMNSIGNCSALQYVQSMEVDPNTGLMWIIDTGRLNSSTQIPQNLCPPKLVVLNMDDLSVVRMYEFPDSVVSHNSNFMNDIVLDYVDGKVRYAYISDVYDAKIIVYDYINNDSHYVQHRSMFIPPGMQGRANIDGIAVSPDFNFVYYSVLSYPQLYAVKTELLRQKGFNLQDRDVISVGNKAGGSDGMTFGEHRLYFGVFEHNAVYSAGVDVLVNVSGQEKLVSDARAKWADTFAWNGTDLWFVANQLNNFFAGSLNFSGSQPDFYIWRVPVQERSYLNNAPWRTYHNHAISIIG